MRKNNSYVKFEFANKNVKKKLYKGQKEVHNFNFYTSGKHLDYISRKTAVYVQETDFDLLEIKREHKDAKQYMNNSTAFNKRSKLSGVYKIFDLEAEDIDIDKEKKELKNISPNQNVWELIINPGELGVDNWLIDKKRWAEIIDKNLTKLLNANGLKKENITGHFVIHSNTDYPHVHLSFWEKEPSIIDKYGNLTFKKKGAFSKSSLEKFNFFLHQDFKDGAKLEYQELFRIKPAIWNLRKHIRTLVNLSKKDITEWNDDLEILSYFNLIKTSLKNKKNKTYAKCDSLTKEAIWKIYDFFKEKNKLFNKLNDNYFEYISVIKNKTFGNGFLENLKYEFLEKEQLDFETQIGNSIINFCLNVEEDSDNDDNDFYFDIDNVIEEEIKPAKKSSKKINYLIKKWDYEANAIYFKKKIEALKRYREIIAKKPGGTYEM